MDENECMICLEEMKDNIAVLSCGHRYHFECITAWANKKKDLYKICTVCPQNNEIINIISTKTKSNSVSQIKKNKYEVTQQTNPVQSRQCIIS